MEYIKTTPEELQKAASSIRDSISDLESKYRIVKRQISETGAYWQGEANEHLITNSQEVFNQGDLIFKNLKYEPDKILKMAGLYIENEQAIVQATNKLPDNIFG